MERSKDNANPTILNASDLPSRRRELSERKREDGGTGLFDGLVPAYNYLNDPFDGPLSSSDSDDDSVDDIDEQEIYGETSRPCPCQTRHLQEFFSSDMRLIVRHCRSHCADI
jgi:hypothetical protein